jgi:hypothetical protein
LLLPRFLSVAPERLNGLAGLYFIVSKINSHVSPALPPLISVAPKRRALLPGHPV